MLRTLAKAAGATVFCLALAGCNTAGTPLATDEETASLGPARCPTGGIIGVGAAVQRTAFEEVVAAYTERCDERSSVTYNVIADEAALEAFVLAEADWIATDSPLDGAAREAATSRCSPHQLLTMPMIANPIALAYHLPGVDRLVLSSPLAGRIFSGEITTWDHPDIAALNPGVPLPGEQINVFARADPSGVTTQVSSWLAETGNWPAERVGRDWTGAGEKKSESSGIIQAVRATPHSIGYAEFSAARDNSVPVAWLDNGAGPVELTTTSAAQGLAEATVSGSGGELRITPKYAGSGPRSYPLVQVGYQTACSSGLEKGKAPLLRDFLGFVASEQQQSSLGELGLAPLPAAIQEEVTGTVGQIR